MKSQNTQQTRRTIFIVAQINIITNDSGSLVEETFYAPYGQILQGGKPND